MSSHSSPNQGIEPERIPRLAIRIARAVREAGGRAWLVGGPVRDLLLGQAPKDVDMEAFGLDEATLHDALASLGKVRHVGKAFGVFRLWTDTGTADVALPRRERKTAAGHKGFAVTPDPALSPEEASRRRDFTINAMMLDPLDGTLLDPHGGRLDLARGLLCHVSPAFAEDPLRVLRGMQFAARFNLRLHPDTARLCRELLAEADTLPAARIWEEWRKWTHAAHPSKGLLALEDSGWLSLYPAIGALQGCPQEPRWHPEGTVWRHTLLVVDQAARVARERGLDEPLREALLLAALCHDFGKPATTRMEDGRIRSPGHSAAGLEPTRAFLASIGAPSRVARLVEPLVREHLCHLHGQPGERAVRRLAARLAPADIELWEALVEADASGRAPHPPSRPGKPWLDLAHEMEIRNHAPRPLARGRMLIEMGLEPGPEMGRLLKEAWEAQLDGAFTDEAGARAWLSRKLGRE